MGPLLFLISACSDKGSDSEPVDSDTPTDTDSGEAFTIYSPDFESSAGDPLAAECGNVLSKAFECENGNPEIRWEHAPSDAQGFALILDDPDADGFAHWAIYNLPLTATGLGAGISGKGVTNLPAGALELENGAGFTGYLGSCPPEPHVYRWRVWALRELIEDKPVGATAKEQFEWLATEADSQAYASAETCHIYGPRT